MPESKASKLRGDIKYYEGVSKENIGKAINNEKLKKEGESDKLAGESERDAASVRMNPNKGEEKETEEIADINQKSKL
ncbi:13531_t:CDS:2 [Funneliformis geosporum]|uniref:279_t:CDS:1 n=1 Tax=Funneliformis geosporum TaxID=1117311 RepID=A0A9W4SWC7_9GLOM|nr:13531_t:CDS:2 [Funneliformis geosporum]CAI2182980.1 279_t:CDS:2 [Funneliformis geosporum]